MGNLTAMAVRAALANPGAYQDGDGLFLKVKKSCGASWMVRVQRDGKGQDLGLGSAKLVTLAEACQKAQEVCKATRVERRSILAERDDEAAAKVTFHQAGCQYHTENEAGWKSTVYARQWLATLENYAFKKLDDMPTGSITSADIISVLTPIWQETPDTARQVRNRICNHERKQGPDGAGLVIRLVKSCLGRSTPITVANLRRLIQKSRRQESIGTCVGHLHAAVLRREFVEGRNRDPLLGAGLGCLRASLLFLQHPNDLLYREP